MSNIKLKKGYDLNLEGAIGSPEVQVAPASASYAIVPDDFTGIVPRLERKEGDVVAAGDVVYHDKTHEAIKVVAPVSGTIKAVNRGLRRKIESIVIEPNGDDEKKQIDVNGDPKSALLESGLWVLLRQRPYDVVPSPDVEPRDIFVTCFDSAPLAPDLMKVIEGKEQYLAQGVQVLKKLTSGDVYLSCRAGQELQVEGANVNTFTGPHPAGNVSVQINHLKPVNKGEVVWTLDVVALARIGELFATGNVNFETLVAVTGSEVEQPEWLKANMGCQVSTLTSGNLKATANGQRLISGNVLTGNVVSPEGWLRAPWRHITVIPEVSKTDEFTGWASLSPKKFSVHHDFLGGWFKSKKPVRLDAKLNGGERAIVMAGEYDAMLPMDIYSEFLIKAIIAYDIDKMEQLGIYEVAPEDFALAEYADTSKLELQRIVREGLDKMRKEME